MSGSIGNDRENDLESELNKGALWAVTYGDLMSYLMIFFMVLFSLYASKTGGAKPLEASAQLVDLQKVFGGKIDPELLERIKNYKKEETVALKLKDSPRSRPSPNSSKSRPATNSFAWFCRNPSRFSRAKPCWAAKPSRS